ncbi:hypothetical protein GCM10025867_02930 [Frondihabitans sucicola]|uniref:Uncharacterized protein n=1 Tax=Frondihabitans sucicola TaxID=1268041 RepID=A0ABM8GIQ2_9MICO|nr:hypothetical protein GCM10025867_02930 [Frondihabitans sucicola]
MKAQHDRWRFPRQEPDDVASDEVPLAPPETALPEGAVVADDDGAVVSALVPLPSVVLAPELLALPSLEPALESVLALPLGDDEAPAELLSLQTAIPLTAAIATPAAPTAAVATRALRSPLIRTFIAPPLARDCGRLTRQRSGAHLSAAWRVSMCGLGRVSQAAADRAIQGTHDPR